MRRLPFCTLAAASHSLPSSPNERNGGDTIAIYHCSIKIVSRGKGKSAAAAYRSGEKLTNEWDGLTHDYTKKGGVIHSEILLPAHAPPAFSDRSTLWNSVELSEKSNNAQLAREVEIALPVELSREEQTRLVREYCSSQFVSKGMIADFNLHDTGGGNPHAHILLTMRPLDEKGAWLPKSKKEYVLDENGEKIRLPSGKYKTRKVDLVDWNNRENAEVWRSAWADLANEFLVQNDRPERIDHRSHAERGMDELPTVRSKLQQAAEAQRPPPQRAGSRSADMAKQRRDVLLKVRVTPEERELIRQKMALLGTMNMGAYLRKMAIDGYVVKLDLPELRELVSLLRYSSNNLNQLTRRVHETGRVYAADMEDILRNQERIWQAASGILSRLAAIK